MNTTKSSIATFAAGCFWGVEEVFRTTKGVLETEVGYTGGHTEKPSYHDVCDKNTGHAEAVRVTFNPDEISYAKLLQIFWENHDPTQVNRQGPDVGDQYRSAIFYHNEEQRKIAEMSKDERAKSGKHRKPIATEITKAGPWYRAEEYHQKYAMKHGGASCHF